MSTGKRVLLYIASILIPIAGLVIGAVYMLRDSPEEKRVGTICLILGIVCIVVMPILLSALLYFMVLGFGSDGIVPPVATLRSEPVADGVRFTFNSVHPETSWSDLMITFSDGRYTDAWYPTRDALTGSPGVTVNMGVGSGPLAFSLTIMDVAGNGRANGGDSMTVYGTFAIDGYYTLTVIHGPTMMPICMTTVGG